MIKRAIEMRVGVNTLFLIPGEVGGTETYLRQTLKAMAENFSEIGLVLFTNRENDKVLRDDLSRFRQVEFVLLDFSASNRYGRIIREQIELPSKVKHSGVGILWSPGYTLPFFSSCPQVVTIHDMQYKTHPDDLTFLARVVTDALVRMAARRCARIVAVSAFSKSEIMRYTVARAEKIDVIHEAADPAFSELVPEDLRVSLLSSLIPSTVPYILLVSNTYPHKNVHAAVEAFGQIMADIPHHLVLVGQPRLGEPAVQEAIGSIADPSRVRRLNYMAREDLIALYQAADLFIFPSLYEGFGLPVLEAMIAGTPVVATRCASISEAGGENVVYFDHEVHGDLAVKIRDVLAWSPDERERWVASARRRAGQFTWPKVAAETVKCFRRALS